VYILEDGREGGAIRESRTSAKIAMNVFGEDAVEQFVAVGVNRYRVKIDDVDDARKIISLHPDLSRFTQPRLTDGARVND
jgi:hypothetical protein